MTETQREDDIPIECFQQAPEIEAIKCKPSERTGNEVS